MKGALVEFTATFGASVPNVIIFQFNPETLQHTWSQAAATTTGADPLAASGLPGESFSFTLQLDVNDLIADLNPLSPASLAARTTGLYTRLAALEMLVFPAPTSDQLSGNSDIAGSMGSGDGAGGSTSPRETPTNVLPTVLFMWGAGRILPVRVTSLSITEKLFDELLNPTHADVQLELRVLNSTDLESETGPLADLANAAYSYSQNLREALALANLGNSVGSYGLPPIPGM